MSDKKHIDRIFQERFKDFEVAPSDSVWKNIETELNKDKKKRRIIPIWWRYAGVAAVLLLLLTIGGIYFSASDSDQPIKVVETEDITKPELNRNKISNLNEEKEVFETTSNSLNESSIASTSSANKTENKSSSSVYKKSTPNKSLLNSNNNIVSSNSKEKNNRVNTNYDAHYSEKEKDVLNNTSKDNTTIVKVENEKTENNSLSIEEAIDKTKNHIAEKKSDRWRISPNAAPVYFNSLGQGSSIDPQFNNNSKTGEFNMSYGISASYVVNDKIKVRSGINKVNLGYNTNNVVVFQSAGVSSSSKALQNLDANSSANLSESLSVISGDNLSAAPNGFETTNTSINQSLGYIEVPLEIQYALLNNKFGINVIGGFSSFFLSNNKIYSETESGGKNLLGEASNINNVSYSANFGFGLNYQVSKKIDLNVEPMFKYQINTFNNTSGDFKPYFIGVYTGFAIKF